MVPLTTIPKTSPFCFISLPGVGLKTGMSDSKLVFDVLTQVVDREGKTFEVSDLVKTNKVIGLYFSTCCSLEVFITSLFSTYCACKPSFVFLQLVEAYKNLRAAGKTLEIIFCSSDHNVAACEVCLVKMPWKALVSKHGQAEESLKSRYGVTKLHSLVLVDATMGTTISTMGRRLVINQPDDFPWNGVAYHVTGLKEASTEVYTRLNLAIANDMVYDGALQGLPVVCLSTTLYNGKLPTISPYPRGGNKGTHYKRVSVPLNLFGGFDWWLMSSRTDQIHILLTSGPWSSMLKQSQFFKSKSLAVEDSKSDFKYSGYSHSSRIVF
jgi:hypothetical protein